MSQPADNDGKIFFDGLLAAVASLPDADLEPLVQAVTEQAGDGAEAIDRPALAVAVADTATRLEAGLPEPPFDAASVAGAREWLQGYFRGVGLYHDRWQGLTGNHPETAYTLLVLAALLDPATGGQLPGAKDAVEKLEANPTLVTGMVANVYRDLRTPPPTAG